MCLGLYENSQYRCEGDFDFEHYYYDNNFEIYRYGKDQTGCNKIEVMQATKQSMQGAVWQDLIISVMLLITAAGGFALYSVWWRKRKSDWIFGAWFILYSFSLNYSPCHYHRKRKSRKD
jgi:hypothetical protein